MGKPGRLAMALSALKKQRTFYFALAITTTRLIAITAIAIIKTGCCVSRESGMT
jgi:hypothetical protein